MADKKINLWTLVSKKGAWELLFCPNNKEKAEQTEKLATLLGSIKKWGHRESHCS